MTFEKGFWTRVPAESCLTSRNSSFAFLIQAAIGAAAICALACTSAFAGESPYQGGGTRHYYCSSEVGAPGSTVYFSAAFDAKPAGGSDVNSTQLADSFKQAAEIQYGYDGKAVCFGNYKTLAEVQAAEQKRISAMRAANKWTVVETGWTPDSSAGGGSAPAASAPSNASSQSSTPAVAAAPAQNSTPLSTTLAVRMLEEVDSGKYSGGRQYRGVVTKAADAGNGVTIPSGSMAMVILVHGQSGWIAQLTSLAVKGQPMNVSSGPATVMGSAQSAATGAMSTVTSALGGFGFGHKKPAPQSAAAAIASGQRVFLPPGTQLQFVLNSASSMAPASGGMANSAGMPNMPSAGGGIHPNSAGANAAAMSTSSQSIPVGNLTARITETLLGPRKPLGQSAVSPDGGHYAVSSMHGSREIVIIDGVSGPDFDHAGKGNSTALDIAFSQDGKHSCYVAQRGDQLFEVRDNKEAFAITTVPPTGTGVVPGLAPIGLHGTAVANPGHQCLVSASGAHMAVVSAEQSKTGGPAISNVFLDGVKSPAYLTVDVRQMAFVGEKLIYAAQTNDHKWHMVVNANAGPAYDAISGLLLNHEDTHYAFITQGPGGHQVVVDGVAGPVRAHGGNGVHDLTLASNGRCAYIWDKPLGNAGHDGMVQALVVDEREVAEKIQPLATEDTSLSLNSQIYILFSPDGKKVAYAKQVPGGVASVIDGKVSRAYNAINVTAFSPDSAHAFFVGVRNQYFVVVDGQELDGFNRAYGFVWSKQGGRLGFVGFAQDGSHFVIDGKQSQRYYSAMNKTLSFSPDGKHYVYAACTNYMKCAVVMDGNETPVPDVAQFTTRSQPRFEFPSIFWSDDSARLAYAHTNADGTNNTVFVINGQQVMHNTGLYEYPAFSSDSKHFATLYWTGHAYSLFLDGKSGAPYEELLEANPNAARFENAHTYRFLGIKGGSVYRVTVDLGG